MEMREIEKILVYTWKVKIRDGYLAGLYCSEKNLQADMYHHLVMYKKYKVWVEPSLKIYPEPGGDDKKSEQTIRPDLMISAGNEVIACIELKYVPHAYAMLQTDIDKLRMFTNQPRNKTISLQVDPATGEWEDEGFTIAEDLLSVFAVIADENAWANHLEEYYKKEKKTVINIPNFLHLYGRVSKRVNEFGYTLFP